MCVPKAFKKGHKNDGTEIIYLVTEKPNTIHTPGLSFFPASAHSSIKAIWKVNPNKLFLGCGSTEYHCFEKEKFFFCSRSLKVMFRRRKKNNNSNNPEDFSHVQIDT